MSGKQFESYGIALTALAGGGQTGATLLSGRINSVDTVATTADSVQLPPARFGNSVVAINNGANSMNVFPSVGEKINALSANAALAVAAAGVTIFFCASAGRWNSK